MEKDRLTKAEITAKFKVSRKRETFLLTLFFLAVIWECLQTFVVKDERLEFEKQIELKPMPKPEPSPCTAPIISINQVRQIPAKRIIPIPTRTGKKPLSNLFRIVWDFEDEPIMLIYSDILEYGILKALQATLLYTKTNFKTSIIPIYIHLTDRTNPAPKYFKGIATPFSKIESSDLRGHLYLYLLERYTNENLMLDPVAAETISGNKEVIKLIMNILLDQKADTPKIISSGILSIYPNAIAYGRRWPIKSLRNKRLQHRDISNLDNAGEQFFYDFFYFSRGRYDLKDIDILFRHIDQRINQVNRLYLTKAEVKLVFDKLAGRDTTPLFLKLAKKFEKSKNSELQCYAQELKLCARKLYSEKEIDISIESISVQKTKTDKVKISAIICNNSGKPFSFKNKSVRFNINGIIKTERIDTECIIPPYGDMNFFTVVDYKELEKAAGDKISVTAETNLFSAASEVTIINNVLTEELILP
jgi:hypothetical protein